MNPHDYELIGLCQSLYWNDLEPAVQYEFELIDYFSSVEITEGKGCYEVYHAQPLYDLKNAKKGDDLILYLSKQAWLKSMAKLPLRIKIPCQRKFAQGKNLYVKIERFNSKVLILHHEEPREPSLEQLNKARQIYGILRENNEKKNPPAIEKSGF